MEVMEQRRSEIVAFVNERESVTFAQLKERFPSVSEMTLRTDLKVLDQNRQLVRIHGGAKSIDQVVGNDDVLKRRWHSWRQTGPYSLILAARRPCLRISSRISRICSLPAD